MQSFGHRTKSRPPLDLAERGLLLHLARMELALRKRPVVVGAAVDDCDLEDAVLARPADEPACRMTTVFHIHERSFGDASFFQAFFHLPRSRWAEARSSPASSPAANTP